MSHLEIQWRSRLHRRFLERLAEGARGDRRTADRCYRAQVLGPTVTEAARYWVTRVNVTVDAARALNATKARPVDAATGD